MAGMPVLEHSELFLARCKKMIIDSECKTDIWKVLIVSNYI